jgi:hypothetical protein
MKFTILTLEAFLLSTMHLVFLALCVVSEKNFFFRLVNFFTFCPTPRGAARSPEMHNLCPLVVKMYHTEFEKNWSSYQEVINVQM